MTARDARALEAQLIDRRERILTEVTGSQPNEQLVRLLKEIDGALERIGTGTYGVCEQCHESIEAEYLRADPLARICLDHLSRGAKDAIERDLELAARVQGKLLPSCNTLIDGWELCYHYEPYGPVGGDYCDLIRPEEPGGDHYFFLGDVSGKGVAASLLVAWLHATFRSLALAGLPLERMIDRANRLLCETTLSSNFVTLAAGRMTAEGEVELVNAGHCLPLLVRNGQIRSIETTGLPLGIFFSGSYRTVRAAMEPGDTLLLYTDGLSESRNAAMEEFSDARVSALVSRTHRSSPEELIRSLLGDLSTFRGKAPKVDDLSLMAMRRIAPRS